MPKKVHEAKRSAPKNRRGDINISTRRTQFWRKLYRFREMWPQSKKRNP